jgi:hypothetical protein
MTQQHWIAACLIRLAAGCAPQRLSDRLTEEKIGFVNTTEFKD